MLTEFIGTPHFSSDLLLLLPLLVVLEAVLSADNAVALAAIARGLENPEQQRKALNLGLVVAYILRMLLILTASWVTQFRLAELAGALYLLWLAFNYFRPDGSDTEGEKHHHRFTSLWASIPTIALTDLAFSLDSVTTAIAVSRETWLVLLGGTIGVITLRFLAGLFIRWLKEYDNLKSAGYGAVALVGLRLLVRAINESLTPPEWVMVSCIVVLFIWGFSKKTLPLAAESEETVEVTKDPLSL
ncbi:TerC family protein [Synechococcus elongatus]|nr:DUF475 domain-containing protein [Synechococcus elongatus]